ncbi:hypothetical protein PSTT_04690 [Puccinia striiformis]|uniref:Uncharacterized protein n=1 Tax=Puccinia striiformis TaxID=27350 RepID=A0A2S4VRX0_9BASI|nr:hypothetical protein PSTT_04690 [Puccinia striiformis]
MESLKPPTNLLQNPNIQLVDLPKFPDRNLLIFARNFIRAHHWPFEGPLLSAGLLWTLLSSSNKFPYIMSQAVNS